MTNQIALVTGANGGIGSKITEELVKQAIALSQVITQAKKTEQPLGLMMPNILKMKCAYYH